MATAWTRLEIEAIVADYFDMFAKELRGESYNKTAHRRALAKILNNRSDGSIERKHQNISAVLLDLDYPYIDGYKPLAHYQDALFDEVSQRIEGDSGFVRLVSESAEEPATRPVIEDVLGCEVTPPEPWKPAKADKLSEPRSGARIPKKGINYLAREASNSTLGKAGEEFVVDFERVRLERSGKAKLANRIEHVARTVGDGLGYDVLSFEESGKERLIEVKTTAYGKATPFYVTRNEVTVSRDREAHYHLYRVFTFRKSPRLYRLKGALERLCFLDPTQYVARVM